MSEPITNAEDAVAELGALPVPVGVEPQTDELSRLRALVAELTRENERLQRVADHEHKAFLDTHNALNLVVQDAQRLAAENGVSELVAERNKLRDDVERAGRRVENSRKANRDLRARIAELEAERHSTNEALDDAVQALRERTEPSPALITLSTDCANCGHTFNWHGRSGCSAWSAPARCDCCVFTAKTGGV